MKIIILFLLVIGFVLLIVDAVKSMNSRRHSSHFDVSSSDRHTFYNSDPNSNSHRSYHQLGKIQKLIKILGIIFFLLKLVFLLLISPFLLLFSWLIIIPLFFITMPIYDTAFEKVKREVDKYLNAAIPEIVSNWNYQELVQRASSDFLKYLEEKELQTIFDLCAKTLGKLTCYQVGREGFKSGRANGSSTTKWWEFFTIKPEPMKLWKFILMNYEIVAIFEKSMANIEIQIVKESGQYLINSMNISIGSKSSQQSFRLGIQKDVSGFSRSTNS